MSKFSALILLGLVQVTDVHVSSQAQQPLHVKMTAFPFFLCRLIALVTEWSGGFDTE